MMPLKSSTEIQLSGGDISAQVSSKMRNATVKEQFFYKGD